MSKDTLNENLEILKELRDNFKDMKFDIVYLKNVMTTQIDKKLELRQFELCNINSKLQKILEMYDVFSEHINVSQGVIATLQVEVSQLKADIHSIIYHLDKEKPETISVELQDVLERYEEIAKKIKE